MTDDIQAHWREIDPDRMARYMQMFRWSEAAESYYAAARIGPGQRVADFGCGPGYTALEFARRVGPEGHVHALDVNAEFIDTARAIAAEAGLSDRVTAHLLTDGTLPLPDGALDRATARNTLIYVSDPTATLAEFRRVLAPGGLAHAIEGDWPMMLVEPLPPAEWSAVIEAAQWAWPHPDIGRRLHGHFRAAGFADPQVQVLTAPDTTGRLRGMLTNVLGYAREGGMPQARIDRIAADIDAALDQGRLLVVAPQFVVTAAA